MLVLLSLWPYSESLMGQQSPRLHRAGYRLQAESSMLTLNPAKFHSQHFIISSSITYAANLSCLMQSNYSVTKFNGPGKEWFFKHQIEVFTYTKLQQETIHVT